MNNHFTLTRYLLLMSCAALGTMCTTQDDTQSDTNTEGQTSTDSGTELTTVSDTGSATQDTATESTTDSDTSTEPLDGVFIQPYESCQPPLTTDTVPSDDGEVCTQVAISGCTEAGRLFGAYGSCDAVLTQRPYWEKEAFGETADGDPRLADTNYMSEIKWLTTQVEACGCTCCHDSTSGRSGAVWDVADKGIWLDNLSDQGLAILSGRLSSRILGAFPPSENNGFDRSQTGIPTTDVARAHALLNGELERRGVTQTDIDAMGEFGAFLVDILEAPPTTCSAKQGVMADGRVLWTGGGARYIYVTVPDAKNPGVPPNLDKPEGTIWRLDVNAWSQPVGSGLRYGDVPAGTRQAIPASGPPPALVKGQSYKLYVLYDILLPVANCLFTAS
jgi:hypothetical protein